MTVDCFTIPLEPAQAELRVANSRFIADLTPCVSVEAARDFQKQIKARNPDANHHVPAFVLGHGNSVITHCSDDGEPSGTAGRPALAVLQGSGLGDAAVVVTRYFGGTKLGTGGLVKAYGDAVREVLKVVKKGVRHATITAQLQIPYLFYEPTQRAVSASAGEVLQVTFGAEVSLTVRVLEEAYASFAERIQTLTAGQFVPQILERRSDSVFPL